MSLFHFQYSDGSNFAKGFIATRCRFNAGGIYWSIVQTWLHTLQIIVCVVFHSNFAVHIVCQRYKPCEFLGFAWNGYWSKWSNNVTTSQSNYKCITAAQVCVMTLKLHKPDYNQQYWHYWELGVKTINYVRNFMSSPGCKSVESAVAAIH